MVDLRQETIQDGYCKDLTLIRMPIVLEGRLRGVVFGIVCG